jgi:hypothetical protein
VVLALVNLEPAAVKLAARVAILSVETALVAVTVVAAITLAVTTVMVVGFALGAGMEKRTEQQLLLRRRHDKQLP